MKTQFGILFLVAQILVYSDAWFWSWSSSTTLAPTVEHEGSGGPPGSGEQQPENRLGADIINEGHGIQEVVQTWEGTTEVPLQTTTQLENDWVSDKGTEEISSLTSKPGNSTTSTEGTGPGGSQHSPFTGKVSDYGSYLALDSDSGLKFESSWGLGFKTYQLKEVIVGLHTGVDGGVDVASQTEELNFKFPKGEVDDGRTHTDLNFDLSLVAGSSSAQTSPQLAINQLSDVTQLTASESTGNQEALISQVSLTSQVSFVWPTHSTSHSQEKLISQAPVDSKRPDTAQTQAPDSISTAVQINHHALASDVEQGPGQVVLFSGKEAVKSASPQCLLLDSALPFCSFMLGNRFAVPNHLNQSSVEDIQALFDQCAWLLMSHCHHSLEFCLLSLPKCGSLGPLTVLPCRSFCEVLRDSCWTVLDKGHLPVECHTLPDEEEDGYQCLSVSNWKGNQCFKRILVVGFIFHQIPASQFVWCFQPAPLHSTQ